MCSHSPHARWGSLGFIRVTSSSLSCELPISVWALLDLNCKLQIAVDTAGPHYELQIRCQWALPDLNYDSRSQWALLGLNCELQISARTAGPQPRAPDLSGHCCTSASASLQWQWALTSTATSRSQCALPDLNYERQISVGTDGPQLRPPDLSGHCRTSARRHVR